MIYKADTKTDVSCKVGHTLTYMLKNDIYC